MPGTPLVGAKYYQEVAPGVEMDRAELAYRPTSLVPVEEKQAAALVRLIELLEELDDVDAVHANFDAPAEVLERVAG